MTPQEIPIFDSLTHPSLDGTWLAPRWNGTNSFSQVAASMKEANVRWAWAVSMGTTGAYDIERYVEACEQPEVHLFPAAFMEVSAFTSLAQAQDWLLDRKQRGFLGVKLHPRVGRFNFQHPFLPGIITAANQLGLTTFLCTYFYSSDPVCRTLNVETLRELLHSIAEERLILLHSGATHLLDVSEMTRPFKKVLLDLSFTMCEYGESSLDLDLRYVMDRCRGRVCIGSDSPEHPPSQMRSRFEQLTSGFDREHREQLAFRNMFTFTGLPFEYQAS